MKRLRIILGFLLLGAIINVAVAWGCAWRKYEFIHLFEGKDNIEYADERAAAWWRSHAPKQSPLVPDFVGSASPHFGLTLELGGIYPAKDNPGLDVIYLSAGWPLGSLSATGWGVRHTNQSPQVHGAVDLTNYQVDKSYRWLPLIPQPLGFLLDTIIYAALVWLITRPLIALRRRVRDHHVPKPECDTANSKTITP